jgi:hypothetical protein
MAAVLKNFPRFPPSKSKSFDVSQFDATPFDQH